MERRSKDRPRISVVIPLYNHAHYIGAALESILGQTVMPDEIVLIDDGSIDGGIAQAEVVLKGYPNARVYRQANKGTHNTLNTLVRISRGDYIAVLNSDDMFMPTKLARCHEIIAEQPGADVICGAIELVDSAGQRITQGPEIDWLARARGFYEETGLRQLSLLNENYVATTSNIVFSRSVWQHVNGFHDLRYCHDIDFLMATFTHTNIVVDDFNAHIRYRVHPSNTIKEDVRGVRLELAAVIAATLSSCGHHLLRPNLDDTVGDAFRSFMRNKSYNELIALLQTLYPGFSSRAEFYAFVLDADQRPILLDMAN
jgi:glycosyltransferase involved in cell wall biosynthesis